MTNVAASPTFWFPTPSVVCIPPVGQSHWLLCGKAEAIKQPTHSAASPCLIAWWGLWYFYQPPCGGWLPRGEVCVCAYVCVRVCMHVCLYVSCLGTPLTRELPACCRKPCASVHLHIKICDMAQSIHTEIQRWLWCLIITVHHDNEPYLQELGALFVFFTDKYFPSYTMLLFLLSMKLEYVFIALQGEKLL